MSKAIKANAPAVLEEDYRALQIFNSIPAGHIGVIVTGGRFAPHLKPGEVAIVDTEDKAIQLGELFVITLSEGTPRMSLAIVQLLREVSCGADDKLRGLMYGFHLKENGGLLFEGRRLRYVDGPLDSDYWPTKCVGRIVGVSMAKWEGRR